MNPADQSRKHGSAPASTAGRDSVVTQKAPALQRLGRYRIVCELASGGMAQVYLAVADGLEKLVALKVVHPHLAREEHFVHMFLDEARIASGIRHRNVCNVFDYGEENGHYYMAMDFLAGRTLREVMRRLRGKRPGISALELVSFVVSIIADAADGLHAAHELCDPTGASLGVVHRDVSPHNIFVGFDGHAAVIDFGIAHAAGRLQNTATGVLKGKFSYMAPEQIREKQVDRRVDVWALGVCLWEALTQRRLFARDSQADTLMSVMSDTVRPPSSQWPELSPALDAITLKALSRDKNARYASAREFARDLRGYLRSEGVVLSADEMEQRMLSLFSGEAVESEQLVRRARSGSLTGLQPVSAELLLAQRKGTHSGTRLRPVTLPEPVLTLDNEEPSVVFTPATNSVTPSMLLMQNSGVPQSMATVSTSTYGQYEGALGSAHSAFPSTPSPAPSRRWMAVLGLALGGVGLAAALMWPSGTAPAPLAPVPGLPAQPALLPTAPVTPSALAAPERSAPVNAAPASPARAGETAASPSPVLVHSVPAKPWASTRPVRSWMSPAQKRAAAARAARPDLDEAEQLDASEFSGETPSAAHEATTAVREPSLPAAPIHALPPALEAPAPAPRAEPARPVSRALSDSAPVHHTHVAAFNVQQVHGALGSSAILRTLTRATSAVEQCANSKAATSASLETLDVQIAIDEMGHVAPKSGAKHPVLGLGACVQGALSKLRSDQKPDVGTVTAEIQISFRTR